MSPRIATLMLVPVLAVLTSSPAGCGRHEATETRADTAPVTAGSALGVHGAYEGNSWFTTQMIARVDAGFDFETWTSGHLGTLGVGFTRVNTLLVWDVVEPTLGGPCVWNKPDDVLRGIYAPGNAVEALVGFDVGQRLDPVRQRDPLAYSDEFRRFVRAVVERYDGDGVDDVPVPAGAPPVRVRRWQAGNEWPGWIVRQRTRADYADFVRLLATAAREADTEAQVVLIGQMPADPLTTWWQQTVVDLAGVVNAVDLHDWNDAAHWQMTNLTAARAWLDANGLESVAIVSGENATHVGTATAPQQIVATAQSLADQAAFLVKRVVWNRANGLDKLFWSLLVDRHEFMGDPTSFFDSIGLVGDGEANAEPVPAGATSGFGARRPSYWALKLLAESTDATVARQLGSLELTDDATRWVYAYERLDDGRRVYVLWTDGSTQELTVPIVATRARVINAARADEAGTFVDADELTAADGVVKVAVDGEPRLVLEL